MQERMLDTILIGAGQSGLAAGYYLQKAGLQFLILEQSLQDHGSWSTYYDSLKLFSPAGFSSLPGMKFPGKADRYPAKSEVISYLTEYARRFQFPIKYGIGVKHVTHEGSLYHVEDEQGNIYTAKAVICASGSFRQPFFPSIPNMEAYEGKMMHSQQYKNAQEFIGQKVIVVGGSNSAVQIGVELSEVAEVTIASRQPIRFIQQRRFGKDLHYWLNFLGLDHSRIGKRLLQNSAGDVLDQGVYEKAVKENRLERSMFSTFTRNGVRWPDGSETEVDTVILATGFLPHFPYLQSLNALDEAGKPHHKEGASLTHKGLYYIGLPWQTSLSSATIRGSGKDAKMIVYHLKKQLRNQQKAKPMCCRSSTSLQ